MVFRAGLRDPCTRDVARLSESVKILEPQVSVFLCFPKDKQHPKQPRTQALSSEARSGKSLGTRLHPKCMDYAILLGKGNCFITDNHSETMTF